MSPESVSLASTQSPQSPDGLEVAARALGEVDGDASSSAGSRRPPRSPRPPSAAPANRTVRPPRRRKPAPVVPSTRITSAFAVGPLRKYGPLSERASVTPVMSAHSLAGVEQVGAVGAVISVRSPDTERPVARGLRCCSGLEVHPFQRPRPGPLAGDACRRPVVEPAHRLRRDEQRAGRRGGLRQVEQLGHRACGVGADVAAAGGEDGGQRCVGVAPAVDRQRLHPGCGCHLA